MVAADRMCFVLALVAGLGLGCASGGGSAQKAEEKADRRKAVARYNVGVHHLSEGRTALALRELRVALDKAPDDPWIHLALAEGYRRKANPAEAETHLRQALLIDPGFQQAQLTLSALLVQTGNELCMRCHEQQQQDQGGEGDWRQQVATGRSCFDRGFGGPGTRRPSGGLSRRGGSRRIPRR